jgi:hypothetical protein
MVKRDFHAYFESDVTYEVQVSNVATGKVLTTFIRNEFENSNGESRYGVRAVEFKPDSSAVIATDEDGEIETVELPAHDK